MFSAVIKGTDTGAASVVARAHGFRTVRVHAELQTEVTLILAGDSFPRGFPTEDLNKMVKWYAEDLGRQAGFPPGSLLYFRELSPDEIAAEGERAMQRKLDELDGG